MGKPVPERVAAKAAGERFYWTGQPCRNGHVAKRYTGTGICSVCAVKNTLTSLKRAPQHPNRIAAREAGAVHYSTGVPCRHGHDLRFVSNGICVRCGEVRQRKYHTSNPGLGARWARERRVKDPTGHRKSSIKWMKNNPEMVRAINKRMKARDPEGFRRKAVVACHQYRARKRTNGGMFTPADIDAIRVRQHDACAACGKSGTKLEIDHIVATAMGGSSDPSNLQLLCMRCNRSKGKKDYKLWLIEHHSKQIPYETRVSVLNN